MQNNSGLIKQSQQNMHAWRKRKQVIGVVSWGGEGFTWLQAGLLHGSLCGSNGYPSIFKVGLSDTTLALTSGWAMRAQLAIGGRLGAARAAVGLFQR